MLSPPRPCGRLAVPPLPRGVIDIMPIMGDPPGISWPGLRADEGDSTGDGNVSGLSNGDAEALIDPFRWWLGGAGKAKARSETGLPRLLGFGSIPPLVAPLPAVGPSKCSSRRPWPDSRLGRRESRKLDLCSVAGDGGLAAKDVSRSLLVFLGTTGIFRRSRVYDCFF